MLSRAPSSDLPAPFPHPSRTLFAPGQATYAAANAALDEILRGDAIRWGGWAGAGMAADHAIDPVAGEAFCSVEAKRRAAPPGAASFDTPRCEQVEAGLRQLGLILDAPPPSPQLVLDVPS